MKLQLAQAQVLLFVLNMCQKRYIFLGVLWKENFGNHLSDTVRVCMGDMLILWKIGV
jgi:hypothetical protein